MRNTTKLDYRRVVVVVTPEIRQGATHSSVAARFDNLGLHAYGRSGEEAELNLRKLFAEDVAYYRKLNKLAEHLNRLGLEYGKDWYWEDDYPADGLPIQDAIPAVPAVRRSKLGSNRTPVPALAGAGQRALAMAA